VATIGPSEVRAPAELLRWPLFWSERSACASGATKVATILHILFLLLLFFFFFLLPPLFKTTERGISEKIFQKKSLRMDKQLGNNNFF
jgi:hypothetical protein